MGARGFFEKGKRGFFEAFAKRYAKSILAKNFNDAIASQVVRISPPKTLSVVGARLASAPPPSLGIPTTV